MARRLFEINTATNEVNVTHRTSIFKMLVNAAVPNFFEILENEILGTLTDIKSEDQIDFEIE